MRLNKLPKLDSIHPERILLLESHLIGDCIMSVPLIKGLIAHYPGAKIDVMGNKWSKEILGNIKGINQIIEVKIPWSTYDYSAKNICSLLIKVMRLNKVRYDLILEPRGDLRNAFLISLIGGKRRFGYADTGGEYFFTDVASPCSVYSHHITKKLKLLDELGYSDSEKYPIPEIEPESDALKETKDFLSRNFFETDSQIVGIHPGASKAARKLPPSMLRQLILKILNSGKKALLICAPHEYLSLRETMNELSLDIPIFSGSIREVIALISQLRTLVAMDSAASHIGAAVGVKTIVIFANHISPVTGAKGKQVCYVHPDKLGGGIESVSIEEIMGFIV
ncbi:MAG: glycosyltransferase family 9 protein [Oligoflexales bacterium]|nr:glycosyltransferase family 9 protein [Oligoflexales bacterium]